MGNDIMECNEIIMTLYKCTLECKIKGFPKIVEYLKSSNDDKLILMFEQCENIEGSMYYGYKWIEIKPMKLKDFPEVMQMTVSTGEKS